MIILRFLLNLLLFLIPVLPLAALSTFIARRSREEWQLLAWVPVLPVAIWAVVLAVAVTRDPTSHNLWPFELVGWLALSAVLFVGVAVGRWFAGRRS
jgi:hypothetical protein